MNIRHWGVMGAVTRQVWYPASKQSFRSDLIIMKHENVPHLLCDEGKNQDLSVRVYQRYFLVVPTHRRHLQNRDPWLSVPWCYIHNTPMALKRLKSLIEHECMKLHLSE